MNKSTLIWIAVLAVVVLCGVWFAGRYNALVAEQENVEKAWGQVQSNSLLQRKVWYKARIKC